VWWEGKQMLFLSDHMDEPLSDLWTDISTINLGREGGTPFPSGKKPEALAERLMELCTSPGDLVLDPFCGSGTTAAVAHKTGRSWISVELDPDIAERARLRLARVVAGEDPTGITSSRGWKGGGSFRRCGFASFAP
jgi:adenine-specific DNA-methyltransferase